MAGASVHFPLGWTTHVFIHLSYWLGSISYQVISLMQTTAGSRICPLVLQWDIQQNSDQQNLVMQPLQLLLKVPLPDISSAFINFCPCLLITTLIYVCAPPLIWYLLKYKLELDLVWKISLTTLQGLACPLPESSLAFTWRITPQLCPFCHIALGLLIFSTVTHSW
jgi:hypothetical protein